MMTLGAPAGALTSKRGGGFALRASSSVIGGLAARDRQHRAVERGLGAARGRGERGGEEQCGGGGLHDR